jgi:archaemetzincin
MFRITLVPVGSIDVAVLDWLGLAITDSIHLPCSIGKEVIDPSDTYHVMRQQYNSTQILSKLVGLNGGDNTKLLGVASVDLFIPILTFVFGEAQLGNRAAVISLHRLRQSFYGLPEDDALLYERCEKEAIHELGHTFRLIHCQKFDCVMHFSNSIEQIDLKNNTFCSECAAVFKEFL